MKAVDTNILVRWITRDDPAQAAMADIVMAQPVFLSLPVLLELAWVLTGRTYGFDRAMLAAVLTDMLAVRTIAVAQEDGVRWAIARFAAGADFADMLHIVAGRGCEAFVTFEHRLFDRGGPDAPIPIETLA